jgi:hypothetical protein
LALARTGVFLGYDCVGKEQYQPDAERVRFIVRLAEAGHARQVLLAGDMARRRYLRAWGGGPGYPFIVRGLPAPAAGRGADRRRGAGGGEPGQVPDLASPLTSTVGLTAVPRVQYVRMS